MTAQLEKLLTSSTTTKVLALLAIGIYGARLLHTGNPVLIGLVVLVVAMVAAVMVNAAYLERKQPRQAPGRKANSEDRRTTIYKNCVLCIVLAISIMY